MNSKVKVAIGALVGGLLGFVVGCKLSDKVYSETMAYGPEELKEVVNEFFNSDD